MLFTAVMAACALHTQTWADDANHWNITSTAYTNESVDITSGTFYLGNGTNGNAGTGNANTVFTSGGFTIANNAILQIHGWTGTNGTISTNGKLQIASDISIAGGGTLKMEDGSYYFSKEVEVGGTATQHSAILSNWDKGIVFDKLTGETTAVLDLTRANQGNLHVAFTLQGDGGYAGRINVGDNDRKLYLAINSSDALADTASISLNKASSVLALNVASETVSSIGGTGAIQLVHGNADIAGGATTVPASVLNIRNTASNSDVFAGSVGQGITLELTSGSYQKFGAVSNHGTMQLDSGSTATFSGTVTNYGTLSLLGNIVVTEDAQLDEAFFYTGEFTKDDGTTKSANGYAFYDGVYEALVINTGLENPTTYAPQSVTYRGESDVELTKADNFIGILKEETSGIDTSAYWVNVDEALASNTARTYRLANTANLTFSNVMTGSENAVNVIGKGTVSIKIGKTDGHGNSLNLGSDFHGVLAIEKDNTEGNRGNVNLNNFTMGSQASLKLISGNHWSPDGSTISRDLFLAGKNEDDFQFRHNGTLTITGRVTGTHLYSGRNYNDNGDNNIILKGAGSSIDNVKMTAGTLTVAAADVSMGTINASTLVLTNAGSLNITAGGHINTINYTAGGTLTFTKKEGLDSASYTVGNIVTTSGDNYNRNLNVNAGVTLTATSIRNQYGMGTMDIDGSLIAESITMASKGTGPTENIITGDGSINTKKLEITNAGDYRFSVGNLTITEEFTQNAASMSQYGGIINVTGKLNGTGGTLNLHSGEINLSHTAATNTISSLDMAGDNNRNGKLNLAAGVALNVKTNFWLGGTSVVTLNEGASLTRDGMTFNGLGETSTIKRIANGESSNTFDMTSYNHEVKDSAISITKENTNGNTLALKLTNSSVTNNSSSTLTVNNSANTLTAVNAAAGNVKVVNTSTEKVSIGSITVNSGRTVETEIANLSLGSLTLNGGTMTTTGNLTIGTLVLDLTQYTDMAAQYTLVTSGGENAIVTLTQAYSAMVDGYTATVSGSGTSSLTLSFEKQQPENNSITTTVSGVNGVFDAEENMLTLNVNAALDGVDSVLISGIESDIMKDILGQVGLPSDGMVNISLFGTDGTTFVADAEGKLSFLAADGVGTYGGAVGTGGWQYNVNYIPEPATATLSLLALAGLAARRRRRH